jgi:hypothetical protein
MTTAPIAPLASIAPAMVDALALRMLGAVEAGQSPTPAVAPPTQPPSQPTPIETATQTAVSRQGGLAPLLADLAVAVQRPDLPPPVLAAANRVLALQQPLAGAPSAGDLKQALAQSGLLLEARIADQGAPSDQDLKAALLVLRQAVQAAAPTSPPAAPAGAAPAPPYRGGPLQAQPPAQAGLTLDAPADMVAHRLVQGADGALARETLLQLASTPGAPQAASGTQANSWLFEVPFAAAQGAAIAQFEIGREDEDGSPSGAKSGDPVWRARFSLNLDPMGPVHAKISLSGGRARVTLWAENETTVASLSRQQDLLSQALLRDEVVAMVSVFPGAPRQPAPNAGQFVDQAL